MARLPNPQTIPIEQKTPFRRKEDSDAIATLRLAMPAAFSGDGLSFRKAARNEAVSAEIAYAIRFTVKIRT